MCVCDADAFNLFAVKGNWGVLPGRYVKVLGPVDIDLQANVGLKSPDAKRGAWPVRRASTSATEQDDSSYRYRDDNGRVKRLETS